MEVSVKLRVFNISCFELWQNREVLSKLMRNKIITVNKISQWREKYERHMKNSIDAENLR